MPQYNGVWTLQAQAQALTSQQWVTDPNFKNTTLLLQADNSFNTAQNNTFLDSSANSFAITRAGNTTQGSFSPFSQAPGYWSNYFDGTATTSIDVTANTAINDFGTGDFTIECFFYATSADFSANPTLISCVTTWATSVAYTIEVRTGGVVYFQAGDNLPININSGAITVSVNTWNHIAVSRSSGTTRLFLNGVLSTSTSAVGTLSKPSQIVRLAAFSQGGGQRLTGYLSNVRIIKGQSLYSSSFNVPTEPLTTTSQGVTTANVSLLTCRSNSFVDDSTASPKTLTTSNVPSVQTFGPFAPALQWTPTVVGGAGYFDGTGDYLQTPSSTNLNLSTGDFTIEAWVYRTSAATSDGIFNSVNATGNNSGLSFYVGSDSKLYIDNGVTGTTGYGSVGGRQWNHVAVIRTSGNAYLYVNGVCVNPANPVTQSPNTGGIGLVGCAGITTQQLFDGYISSLRVIKGQALVTGGNNFTPPTIPVTSTAIGWTGANVAVSLTGTVQLLTNFTNAGIYDGKMANALETVGNAQISTSIVKYGSGSMYFDGTGDYLVVPTSPNLSFGSGDFTVEAWVNPISVSAAGMIANKGDTTTNNLEWRLRLDSAGVITFVYTTAGTSGTSTTLTSTATIPVNIWSHVAFCRANNNYFMFINGVLVLSGTLSATIYTGTSNLSIGATLVPSQALNGYVDDLRITKGVARYVGNNFIPPQVALPRQ